MGERVLLVGAGLAVTALVGWALLAQASPWMNDEEPWLWLHFQREGDTAFSYRWSVPDAGIVDWGPVVQRDDSRSQIPLFGIASGLGPPTLESWEGRELILTVIAGTAPPAEHRLIADDDRHVFVDIASDGTASFRDGRETLLGWVAMD